MDIVDRPPPQLQLQHRSTSTSTSSTTPPTTTSELFICFTSRLSHSSSMRLKTTTTTTNNLTSSSSLSRRLRHNGSLRGAQSPAAMLKSSRSGPGTGFDSNPEPSSPKVTCIGQVRVKTKKQGKKMMKIKNIRGSSSKRLLSHGNPVHQFEVQGQGGSHGNDNKKWVHIPMTICEALRTFGAEFSCLLPCKSSSCFSSTSSNSSGSSCNGEKRRGCGAVFKWLLALEEEEEGQGDGKERDIELVVEEDRGCSSRRRSIFDDMEFQDEIFNGVVDEGKEEDGGGGGGGGRVSICVPPKNALLLMRCRSDPMKMASLSHKIWDAGNDVTPTNDDDNDSCDDIDKESDKDSDDGDEEEREVKVDGNEDLDVDMMVVGGASDGNHHDMGLDKDEKDGEKLEEKEEGKIEEEKDGNELEIDVVNSVDDVEDGDDEIMGNELMGDGNEEEVIQVEDGSELMGDANEENGCLIEEEIVQQVVEDGKVGIGEGEEEVGEKDENLEMKIEENEERSALGGLESSQVSLSSSSSSSSSLGEEEQSSSTADSDENKEVLLDESNVKSMEEEEEKVENKDKVVEDEGDVVLPDCLLMMMCEPKLSMEVSKETWVCSTDFIRWLPERHHNSKKAIVPNSNKTEGTDEPAAAAKVKPPAKKKDRVTLPAVQESLNQFPQPQGVQGFQPARSSISVPVASLIEKKLVKAGVGYEPFVLTRCKSAPHRSTAANIAPPIPEMGCGAWRRESGMQLEPHRPASVAGLGF